MKRIRDIIPYFQARLSDRFDNREIVSWAYMIIKHIFNYNRSDYILNIDDKICNNQCQEIIKVVELLSIDHPIQYIIGYSDFLGLKFKVNTDVLIPRPETEELVSWVLEHSFKTVLDIGTGSGCIAITIAKKTNAHITGMDISKDCLKIARFNARLNHTNVEFIHSNIFNYIRTRKYDLIVSNPPYISESDKSSMKKNVLNFEPKLALFVPDNDPLVFYNKIIKISKENLNSGGFLFFEINEKHGHDIVNLMKAEKFVDIELKKDINDKYRMIKGVWK